MNRSSQFTLVKSQTGQNSTKLHIARAREKGAEYFFLLFACMSILLLALICIFLFGSGIPSIAKIGILDFLTGEKWKPNQEIFGILPMIVGSVYVTIGAVLVGVPIGILSAVYLAKFAGRRMSRLLMPAVNLLAGIPSVVYGFFGLVVLVPMMSAAFAGLGGKGKSILTAAVLLGIMILPTIITVSKTAIEAVPGSYYEGSLALGASHERSIFHVVLPAAKSGILASTVLGVGRAIGETMAVIMVAGNQARMPKGILQGARTMTANIVLEMGYAADLHREALIATGVMLFVFILLINLCFFWLKRSMEKAGQ